MCGVEIIAPTEELTKKDVARVISFLNLQAISEGKYVQQFTSHHCSDKVTGIARLQGFVQLK